MGLNYKSQMKGSCLTFVSPPHQALFKVSFVFRSLLNPNIYWDLLKLVFLRDPKEY